MVNRRRDKQKATSAAVRKRIYPLFKSLGYSRQKVFEREDRYELSWQRRREGYLDQLDVGWSKDWDGTFIIHWLTGDVRRLSPAHRGAITWAGELLRPPRRRLLGQGKSGEGFVSGTDLDAEMDLAEARILELDRYFRFGTQIDFISLPGTSPPLTPRLWALHHADVAAARARPFWLIRELFKRETFH